MRNRSAHGFTLVELLVVIGIITLLIAILLPALQRARKMALRTTELANMHQVGLAVLMYANDNHLYLPGAEGNAWGGDLEAHDVVRARLYGFDQAWPYTNPGGAKYLRSTMDLATPNNGIIAGPSSRVWGCTMNGDSPDWHRYGSSWWWNAGPFNTCDANGNPIWCTQNFVGNWLSNPPPQGIADGYLLKVTGSGYVDGSGHQPVPDNIVLITDAGWFIHSQLQVPGNLNIRSTQTVTAPNSMVPGWQAGAAVPLTGTCTLYLSGRAEWRTPKQMSWVFLGGGNIFGAR